MKPEVRQRIREVEAFLHGWNSAVYLRDDPNRDEVLAALPETARDRFLKIEREYLSKVTDPAGIERRAMQATLARIVGGDR